MNLEESISFIRKYQRYYFEGSDSSPKDIGIININPFPQNAEQFIVDKLYRGNYDLEAFAWKNGKIKCFDGESPVYCKCFDTEGHYKGERKVKVSKDDFSTIIKKNNTIEECLFENSIMDKLYDENEFCNSFAEVFKKANPRVDTFGTVNIINQIYFVSKGSLPIFDQFAYKALYALDNNQIPSEVTIDTYADKNSVKRVAQMYYNYCKLLDKVFPIREKLLYKMIEDSYDDVDKNEQNFVFIPRKLDRALWVYGHATK